MVKQIPREVRMPGDQIELAHLADVLEARAASGNRVIAALAGAPGSGKSTLADKLVGKLNARQPGLAAVLPMDGYHYDDLHLVPAGLRPRKGAPMTFDVGGLYHTLKRLRARDEAEVAVPVFDRKIEIARAGARLIPRDVPVIVVEGNWLLLNQAPWDRLRPVFDVTVMVEVPEHVLRARLRGRWERLGLTEPEIIEKLEENDLPNGRWVRDGSIQADHVIRNG
jgi:pantothenate kinase